jgi:hypothetical protein
MKVHDLTDESGRVFAFEVSNTLIGRAGVRAIVDSIPGVTPVAIGGGLPDREVVCSFEVGAQHFVVIEPFGDNSRFWIGPEPTRWCMQLEAVRQTFCRTPQWSLFLKRVAALFTGGRH